MNGGTNMIWLSFEVIKIKNGWTLKGNWIEPAGGDMPARPMSETLAIRDIATVGVIQGVWFNEGFDQAFQMLRKLNQN